MKLYWSSRSPFARKVMVLAHECGLAEQITLIPTVVGATQSNPELARLNPLGQIPTLVLDDGSVIHDSLVICDYLAAIGQQPGMFPTTYPERWSALTRHALGQGMMETLVKLFGERKRQGDPLQPVYASALRAKFHRVVGALEIDCGRWPAQRVDIGDIALACALAYADFRFAEENWRNACPPLADWQTGFAARPSMVATGFSAPAV